MAKYVEYNDFKKRFSECPFIFKNGATCMFSLHCYSEAKHLYDNIIYCINKYGFIGIEDIIYEIRDVYKIKSTKEYYGDDFHKLGYNNTKDISFNISKNGFKIIFKKKPCIIRK